MFIFEEGVTTLLCMRISVYCELCCFFGINNMINFDLVLWFMHEFSFMWLVFETLCL